MARVVAFALLVWLLPMGDAAGEPLRVITFNLLHGGPSSGLWGDGDALEDRFALATSEMRALAPDVIALQEASVARGRGNMAARLAAALGMHHVHAPATTRVLPFAFLNHLVVSLMNFSEGPAVLSRFPIVESEVYDLPRCQKRLHPRVLVRAEIVTPSGPVAIFSTHTSRDDCQVERVADISRARAVKGPAVLMGDLNTTEGSATIRALNGSGGFIDAYRAVNKTATGATVWQRYDSPQPTALRRVDYIFVAGTPSSDDVVSDSRVVLNEPRREMDGRTLWPSDHYGVLADLNLFGIKSAP